MSTALNTDAHDGPPAESVAIVGTDGLPSGSVPDVTVKTLGVPKIASPMAPLLASRQTTEHYVDETDRVLLDDTLGGVIGRGLPVDQLPGLEPCGPRRKIFFDPSKTRAAIVTCGGLCPGLNDVIAGLVRNLTYHYKVRRVIGIQNGYQGFIPSYGHDVIELNPETVRDISVDGGTVLGTSRGPQDPEEIVDCLERLNINMLFVIGGDGSMRGAMQIVRVIGERGLRIAVVGIPKTIDNDIPLIDQSFGFQTAFSLASDAIRAARVEAKSTANGVGLVRLMGRHSGFIACYAALARSDADVVLIPEVPFALDGPHGLLEHVRQRVAERGNAVVVVAEGAGQDLLEASEGNDASGNTQAARHRALPAQPADRALREGGRRDLHPLHRPQLRHPQRPREPLRQRLLRAAVAGRGARGDVGSHRDGGRALAAAVRPPADGAGREPAQPGRPAGRPVDGGSGVDGAAGPVHLTPPARSGCQHREARRTKRRASRPAAEGALRRRSRGSCGGSSCRTGSAAARTGSGRTATCCCSATCSSSAPRPSCCRASRPPSARCRRSPPSA